MSAGRSLDPLQCPGVVHERVAGHARPDHGQALLLGDRPSGLVVHLSKGLEYSRAFLPLRLLLEFEMNYLQRHIRIVSDEIYHGLSYVEPAHSMLEFESATWVVSRSCTWGRLA